MKFKAPTEHESVHMSLTSGHTFVIPSLEEAPDGVEVPPMFQRDAIAAGAEPVGVAPAPKAERTDTTKTEVITKALQAMLDGDDEGDFKKDGTPDLNAVSRRCGFKVQREAVDAIFRTLQAS